MLSRAMNRHPVPAFAGFGIVMGALFALGIWGPISRVLQAGHAAETRRLLEAFEEPLAGAVVKGDDLGKIDELRRLEKLPGVSSARVEGVEPRKPLHSKALVWEGKTVGWLKINVSPTPWRRFRYQCLERIGNAVILLGLFGGLAGRGLANGRRRFRSRLIAAWDRGHKRHRRSLDRLRQKTEAGLLPWTHQALAFSPAGLILLDHRQTVVAFNRRAGECFKLKPESLGSHWLDLQNAPAWASALQRTLECPGEHVPLSPADPAGEISLLTLSTLEHPAGSTWIILPSS